MSFDLYRWSPSHTLNEKHFKKGLPSVDVFLKGMSVPPQVNLISMETSL